MSFFSALDKKDRRLLYWVLGTVFVLAVLAAIFSNKDEDNKNTLPSSFLAGQHGARAAYETLVRSGYTIERWEDPLGGLAEKSGRGTVVVIAEPAVFQINDMRAIRKILDRGGRILVTGLRGGFLLPDGDSAPGEDLTFAACQLKPEGVDALASTGEVWMVPQSTWKLGNPAYRVQYSCAGQAAVVEYDSGKGHVVWWASSTPLENASIGRARNLDLLLNSIGPREGQHIYWDESLHGDVRSVWSFSSGPAQTMLWYGLLGIAILILISFSRRSGPLRALPVRPRTTPVEYLEALGSLYQKAGAAETALEITWERFRRRMLRLCGLKPTRMDAAEVAAVIRSRYADASPTLKADLLAVEDGVREGVELPRVALKLAQSLHHHEVQLMQMARARKDATSGEQTKPQRR
jgi:hypothetical protein